MDISVEFLSTNTLNLFFRALDDCAYKECAELLSETGVWIRQGKPLTGPQMLLEALRARPSDLLTRHIISNMLVKPVCGEFVHATFYCAVFAYQGEPTNGVPPVSLPTIISVYDAQLKCEKGRWLIQSLRSSPSFKQ